MAATPSGPVTVRPSLRLVRPLYYVGFILLFVVAGLINNDREASGYYVLLIVPAIVLLWTVRLHLKQHFHLLTIGGGKLRYQTGMLSKTTRTMDLVKIQDVRVSQSLTQRILGVGSIYIETAGETGGLSMANIDQPQTVAEYILEIAGK
jgi:uncharacterized membrane protein YdbT with pleckstrin-like domain